MFCKILRALISFYLRFEICSSALLPTNWSKCLFSNWSCSVLALEKYFLSSDTLIWFHCLNKMFIITEFLIQFITSISIIYLQFIYDFYTFYYYHSHIKISQMLLFPWFVYWYSISYNYADVSLKKHWKKFSSKSYFAFRKYVFFCLILCLLLCGKCIFFPTVLPPLATENLIKIFIAFSHTNMVPIFFTLVL